jgi:chromosomal replication initiation ATPase DnaA
MNRQQLHDYVENHWDDGCADYIDDMSREEILDTFVLPNKTIRELLEDKFHDEITEMLEGRCREKAEFGDDDEPDDIDHND